jgi:hypothetical protein
LSFVLGACGGGDDDDDRGGGGSKVTAPQAGEGGDGKAGESGKGGDSGKGEAGQAGKGGESGMGEAGENGSGGAGEGTGGMGESGSGGSANMMKTIHDDLNRVTPGKICERLAQILCTAQTDCCTDPGQTQAACETEQTSTCGKDFMADAVAARDEAAFDAEQAHTVFNKLEELALACDPAIAQFTESEDGLRSIFKGTKNAGDACTPTDALDKPMFGAALASCKDLHSYACLPNALGWTCEERGEAGARCYSDLNCVQGLYCNNPNNKITGDKCQARKAVGASCKLFNECESLYCSGGKCVEGDAHSSFCYAED